MHTHQLVQALAEARQEQKLHQQQSQQTNFYQYLTLEKLSYADLYKHLVLQRPEPFVDNQYLHRSQSLLQLNGLTSVMLQRVMLDKQREFSRAYPWCLDKTAQERVLWSALCGQELTRYYLRGGSILLEQLLYQSHPPRKRGLGHTASLLASPAKKTARSQFLANRSSAGVAADEDRNTSAKDEQVLAWMRKLLKRCSTDYTSSYTEWSVSCSSEGGTRRQPCLVLTETDLQLGSGLSAHYFSDFVEKYGALRASSAAQLSLAGIRTLFVHEEEPIRFTRMKAGTCFRLEEVRSVLSLFDIVQERWKRGLHYTDEQLLYFLAWLLRHLAALKAHALYHGILSPWNLVVARRAGDPADAAQYQIKGAGSLYFRRCSEGAPLQFLRDIEPREAAFLSPAVVKEASRARAAALQGACAERDAFDAEKLAAADVYACGVIILFMMTLGEVCAEVSARRSTALAFLQAHYAELVDRFPITLTFVKLILEEQSTFPRSQPQQILDLFSNNRMDVL